VPEKLGGRTRARTWDPLIKRQPFTQLFQPLRCKIRPHRACSQHQPLTTRQFGRLFKEAAKAAGLRKTLSRIRFATMSPS
jgi:hypothetical protein